MVRLLSLSSAGAALLAAALMASPALAQSAKSKPGTKFKDCRDCPEMVVVPAGSFTMGSTDAETTPEGMDAEARKREQPTHKVTISKPFAIGRFEVTRQQYAAFVKETKQPGSKVCTTWNQEKNAWLDVEGATWDKTNFPQTNKDPVACVSLDDATAYAAWLSEKTKKKYRVPSEAEWEYAARGGTATSRYWGNDASTVCTYGNISDAAAAEPHPDLKKDPTRLMACRDGYVYTAPVGKFKPNGYGLYDVIGNVWEWTADCYTPQYEGAPTDGSAWKKDCERHVVKGGGWYARNWFNRAAARSREFANASMGTLGIRVVRDLE